MCSRIRVGSSPAGPSAAAPPWLPQPLAWRELTVEAQTGDQQSMLELYRRALSIRRSQPELGDGRLTWLDVPDGTLAFGRDARFACVVNFSGDPVSLPDGAQVLLSS